MDSTALLAMSTLELFQCGHCRMREDLAAALQNSLSSLCSAGSGEGPSLLCSRSSSTIVEYANAPDHNLTLYTTGACPMPECQMMDFGGADDVTQEPHYDSSDDSNMIVEQRLLESLQKDLDGIELCIIATSTESLETYWNVFDPNGDAHHLATIGLALASTLLTRMQSAIQARSPRFVYDHLYGLYAKEVLQVKTKLTTLDTIVALAYGPQEVPPTQVELTEERLEEEDDYPEAYALCQCGNCNECAGRPYASKLALDLAAIAIEYPCECHMCHDCHWRQLKEMATCVMSDEYVWLTGEQDYHTVPLCCASDDYSEEAEMENWRARVEQAEWAEGGGKDQVSETTAWPAHGMEAEESDSPHSRPVSFEEMAHLYDQSLEVAEGAEWSSLLDADYHPLQSNPAHLFNQNLEVAEEAEWSSMLDADYHPLESSPTLIDTESRTDGPYDGDFFSRITDAEFCMSPTELVYSNSPDSTPQSTSSQAEQSHYCLPSNLLYSDGGWSPPTFAAPLAHPAPFVPEDGGSPPKRRRFNSSSSTRWSSPRSAIKTHYVPAAAGMTLPHQPVGVFEFAYEAFPQMGPILAADLSRMLRYEEGSEDEYDVAMRVPTFYH